MGMGEEERAEEKDWGRDIRKPKSLHVYTTCALFAQVVYDKLNNIYNSLLSIQ
jgi:hypothetical protein